MLSLLQWNAIYFTVLATSVHNDCRSVYIPCVTGWQLLLQEAQCEKVSASYVFIPQFSESQGNTRSNYSRILWLFWVTRQRVVVISYRRFEITSSLYKLRIGTKAFLMDS